MYKVIAYLRCSTGSQTVERQREIAKDYCDLKGYVLSGTIEENVSGAKADRKSIVQLMDLTEKDCSGVCFSEISRLTREHFTKVFTYMSTLKENGIDIHFIDKGKIYKANEEFDLVDFITLAVEAHGAQTERDKIRERMKTGKDTKIKYNPYMFIGGNSPFGYDVVDNPNYTLGQPKSILVKNEERMLAIKRCFEMACSGKTCTDMADYLNNCGLVHKSGKLWTGNEVRVSIIRNKLYLGQRSVAGVVHEVEQIIPLEVFQKANEAIHNRYSNKSRRESYFNPLKGLLVCADCGLPIGVRSQKEVPFYKCLNNAYKNGKKMIVPECHNSQIRMSLMISSIDKMIKEIKNEAAKHDKSIISPSGILRERKKLVETYRELDSAVDAKAKEVDIMREQVATLPLDVPEIIELTLVDKLEQLKKEQLELVKRQLRIRDTITELLDKYNEAHTAREIPTTPNDKAKFYRSIIERIEWKGKYRKPIGTITMILKDGTTAKMKLNVYKEEVIEWSYTTEE